MKIIKKVGEMQAIMSRLKKTGKTIGFVPTMGALHTGHVSLMNGARKENDIVVVSIFVNPAQFGPNEDFNKYPRTFENDRKLLQNTKVDYLFYPSQDQMYGKDYQTYVDLEKLPDHLCGLKRPGHFRGVATVVTKLFNIVMPDTAYFGQKDYQQSVIIKKMVSDLNIPVKIKVMPIVREKDGLAMSSRNKYLSLEERKKATALFQSLKLGVKLIQNHEYQSAIVIKEMEDFILHAIPDAKIDYISIVKPDTLEEVEQIAGKVVIAIAVYVGSTRLIDNWIISAK